MTSKAFPQFSAEYGGALMRFLVEKGVSLEGFLHQQGMEIGDELAFWSAEMIEDLVDYALPRYKSPDRLGRDLADWLKVSAAGVVGQLCMSAPDVRTALENASRFSILGCPAVSFHFESPSISIHPIDYWAKEFPSSYRLITQMVTRFVENFMHYLGVDISFDQSLKAKLSQELLDQRLSTHQGDLFQHLVQFAQRKVYELQESQTWSHRILVEFSKAIGEDLPDLKTLARQFGVSDRHLQRELNKEGVHFQGLKDEYRIDLITSFLEQGYTGSQIYAMVGFQSDNALAKYFKKRLGLTIGDYVRSIVNH